MTQLRDVWANATAYEHYVGRWSRVVAGEFLRWLDVPQGAAWLDVGCGTGALTETVLEVAGPSRAVGVDPSVDYIKKARSSVLDPRAGFRVGDAELLSEPDATFDVVVSGLVLNFVPRPTVAVAEMTRVVRPGGVVGAYVWDYAGDMQLVRHFWDAAVALDPAAIELDESRRFPLCHPDRLESLFLDAGLEGVESCPITIPTTFRDFQDYWSPFLGGQGPAPGYAMSLDEARRRRLRERILEKIPVKPDGSIDLVARAWAVRGSRSDR